jgi:LysM repeat protein
VDDKPEALADRLSQYGLGILLKTHDGTDWMSTYDPAPEAIDGPAQVAAIAEYFEERGVPFHAWCVVNGSHPRVEAEMAASVLNAGARSLYLDVEPGPGFWQGTPEDAQTYGAELRRLAPHDEIALSIDPRPWMLPVTPLEELTPYVNLIAPQQYWTTFGTAANRERFESAGFTVPPGGPSPEFLLDVTKQLLGRFGLPIVPVGPGDSESESDWRRFMDASDSDVSLWRYGITNDTVLSTLAGHRPSLAASAPAEGSYTVKSGDSLSGIAESYGVSVSALKDFNALDDEDYIYVGQRLALPYTTSTEKDGFGTHTVQLGESLSSIAREYETSIENLVTLNNLENPDSLKTGQKLQLGE